MELEHRIGFIGIGIAAVALVATQVDAVSAKLASMNPFRSETGQRGPELMLERAFDIGAGGTLSIDVADADVTVQSGTADGVTVKVIMSSRDRSWARDVFRSMDFDVQMRGNEVSVAANSPDIDWSDRHDDRGGVGVHVQVFVPTSFNAIISTGDGDISMSDMEGEFDLRTSDGDISVGALAGSIHLRTSDGDVMADGLSGSTVSVRTSDGDVSIGALAGPAEITTSDGDVSVYIERAGDIKLRTGDGDITILADEGLRAAVDFSGEEVSLASAFTLNDGRISERGATGTLNGGGPTLHAHTGDGSIVVREKRMER